MCNTKRLVCILMYRSAELFINLSVKGNKGVLGTLRVTKLELPFNVEL